MRCADLLGSYTTNRMQNIDDLILNLPFRKRLHQESECFMG
jgi:hypothetical protein